MEKVTIFGVWVYDTTLIHATNQITSILEGDIQRNTVFFVNAHTLNLAISGPEYKITLNQANYVFGDGTGVRMAFRIIRSRKLKDNVNGTDLIPRLLSQYSSKKKTCFLLGAKDGEIQRAANYFDKYFCNWSLLGYHHGYINSNESENEKAIFMINSLKPDLLLVGMGNPLQEDWIIKNVADIDAKVIIAVGGLFSYWSDDLHRAPAWIRSIGFEWLHILLKQPFKWKRYLIGNFKFMYRVFLEKFKNDR